MADENWCQCTTYYRDLDLLLEAAEHLNSIGYGKDVILRVIGPQVLAFAKVLKSSCDLDLDAANTHIIAGDFSDARREMLEKLGECAVR